MSSFLCCHLIWIVFAVPGGGLLHLNAVGNALEPPYNILDYTLSSVKSGLGCGSRT